MKQKTILLKLSATFAFISLVFSPYLSLGGSYKNLIQLVFSNSFSLTLSFGILLLLILTITLLTYFENTYKIMFFVVFISFIYTCLLISFLNSLGYEEVIYEGPGFVCSLLILGIILFTLTSKILENERLFVGDIVEIALFVSLAVVMDLPFFKIHIGQNGGSISLTMLPLVLLSLRKGPIKGFLASGILYGLLTCSFDGYGFFTFPLDYLLAYGCMCIVGFFKKPILNSKNFAVKYVFLTLGLILCGAGRTLFSTLSGMIFYQLDFVSSLVYNSAYILPSVIGVSIVSFIILPIFLQIMKKYRQ